ncbi:MAG: hypothetical protein FWF20_08565 [Betaproteobacteria bacterium]|nr:hypothetical protein [Betaproteobacteria bacterium]MCL2886817.1 hypothetical protein [Betaproteobacteria bacterium]
MSASTPHRYWPWKREEGSRKVCIEEIVRDTCHQPREALVPSLVERYKNAMETGSEFPPLTLARIKGKERLHLLCGWHRYEAATAKLGMNAVQAIIIQAGFDEARWIAAEDNLYNGHAYTQRGDNRRVFEAYMHARKNKMPDGTLKSYREIERDTQVKKSSLHNWMKEYFPATFTAMGGEKAERAEAGPPEVDHSAEILRAIERATGELENYVGKLSDPKARWESVHSILAAVERMKMQPMEEPAP